MTVTINAHQLGRLIDKTITHIGSEDTEPLHGIRLDVDSTFLYAVASDRYTLAVARYRLNDDEQGGEPFARLIPADYLRSLREWISTQIGHACITISTDENRLVFTSPHTELRIAVSPSLMFPDWRGLLRTMAEQTVDGEPFPALRSGFMQRWAHAGDILRVRVTADLKAVLVFGEDFIGAQMPSRYAGVGPVKEETFEQASELWRWTLAAGERGVDMATDMPEADPGSRYECTKDVRETGESLLQEVLRSTRDVTDADYDDDRDLWLAHIRIGVANWMAYRYLDALYQADPRKAATVVADVAEQLDSGEIGEWAWDTAEESGYDPQKWHDDYENAVAEKNAKSAHVWAERLAAGLNAARMAGITFSVEANEHVAYDEKAEQWAAAKPEPVAASA